MEQKLQEGKSLSADKQATMNRVAVRGSGTTYTTAPAVHSTVALAGTSTSRGDILSYSRGRNGQAAQLFCRGRQRTGRPLVGLEASPEQHQRQQGIRNRRPRIWLAGPATCLPQTNKGANEMPGAASQPGSSHQTIRGRACIVFQGIQSVHLLLLSPCHRVGMPTEPRTRSSRSCF